MDCYTPTMKRNIVRCAYVISLQDVSLPAKPVHNKLLYNKLKHAKTSRLKHICGYISSERSNVLT